MAKLLYVFILIAAVHAGETKDCGEYLQTFTAWDLDVEGKKVARVNTAEVADWDPETTYEGIALAGPEAKSVAKPSLEIEFQAKERNGERKSVVLKKISRVPANSALMQFTEFKPREFFTFAKPGQYEVRLKDGDALVCKSTYRYSPD